MSRFPVLAEPKPVTYHDFVIFYRDVDENGNYGEERERETLRLVTEAEAEKTANAWTRQSWVRGRIYGYRKIVVECVPESVKVSGA
jgi:hypothetical protein